MRTVLLILVASAGGTGLCLAFAGVRTVPTDGLSPWRPAGRRTVSYGAWPRAATTAIRAAGGPGFGVGSLQRRQACWLSS